MTPNRKLRTTAIAAMVAVSTVFAGVTPAIAVPTNTSNSTAKPVENQAAGLNIADGSKLPAGTVKSETELRTATDKVGDAIMGYGDNEDTATLAEVFANYNNPEALNDTEQGALEALTARYNEITATLAEAAQNQADAQASVQAALENDRAANKAWRKVIEYFANLSSAKKATVNALVEKVNKENDEWATGEENLPLLTNPGVVTPEQAEEFVVALYKHDSNVNLYTADRAADHVVTRQYLAALEALLADDTVNGFYSTFKEARPAILQSQRHDIITLQMFLDRSRAQVQVLRIMQAKYAVAVRLIELYENDPIGENGIRGLQSVKEAYYEAVAVSDAAITAREAAEREQLKNADKAAVDLFKGWNNDLGNNENMEDQEELAYEAYRASEAKRTYENIVADGGWQTALNKAQQIDRRYFNGQAAAEKAEMRAAEAEAQSKEANAKLADLASKVGEQASTNAELKNSIKDLAKNIKALADKPAPAPTNPSATPTPTPAPAPAPAPEGSSKDVLVPVAIVGVILALLAAIAGHIPAVAAALPKL